jgi:FixJ family two-component response regulator
MPSLLAIVIVGDQPGVSLVIDCLFSSAGWKASRFSSAEALLASDAARHDVLVRLRRLYL